MENYEQKYKKAIERCKSWIRGEHPECFTEAQKAGEFIFPELKDSEDEGIRKELLEHCINRRDGKQICVDASDYRRWAAWLEKQGEQKPTDKAEPKFKVGDWIINNDKRIAVPTQILEIEKYGYVTSRGYVSFDKVKTDYHFWTIKDVEDGDVLFTTCDNINEMVFIYHGIELNVAHCYFLYSKTNNECKTFNSICSVKADIHPATKEQHDLLFQKMKEAGYEWDAEKKELKKFEQNPSWSEEDEYTVNDLSDVLYNATSITDDTAKEYTDWLKSLKDRVQPQPKQEWSEDDEKMLEDTISCLSAYQSPDISKGLCYQEQIDWLKSIKPNHWKPSKEQMKALNTAVAVFRGLKGTYPIKDIESLYNDLKTFES